MDIRHAIGDVWVRRHATPSSDALAAVKDLRPATVITGASEGVGFYLAQQLAREGRAVVLLARSPELLGKAAAELRARCPQGSVISQKLDVGADDAPALIDALLARHGLYLDVLVNNAGIGVGGRFSDIDPEQLDELVHTNVVALTRLTRYYLPAMRSRARGGVLNVASLASFTPGPWQAPYFASKAYVLSLTAAIGTECSGEGVRVCAMAFGPINTQIHRKMGTLDTLYRMILPTAQPERMAAMAWRSFRLGRRVVVPGLVNGLLAASVRVLPFGVMLPLAAWLMKPRRWLRMSRAKRRFGQSAIVSARREPRPQQADGTI